MFAAPTCIYHTEEPQTDEAEASYESCRRTKADELKATVPHPIASNVGNADRLHLDEPKADGLKLMKSRPMNLRLYSTMWALWSAVRAAMTKYGISESRLRMRVYVCQMNDLRRARAMGNDSRVVSRETKP